MFVMACETAAREDKRMGRKAAPHKSSEFQNWANKALDDANLSLQELARRTEADYTHLWKIFRGNPEKYPTSKRPGYELTLAIGTALGDLKGALESAGYPVPSGAALSGASNESNSNLQTVLKEFESLPPSERRGLLWDLTQWVMQSENAQTPLVAVAVQEVGSEYSPVKETVDQQQQ